MVRNDRDLSGLTEKVKPFIAHGVEIEGRSGNQVFGLCPFSGKPGKFYINTDNLCWDSKVAGVSGNLMKFLELRQQQYQKNVKHWHMMQLASDRGLPMIVFDTWKIGHNGSAYTLLYRDFNGKTQDLRGYQIGKHWMSTPGCSVGLLGAEKISKRPNEPIYVCEGEWDTMALTWLLAKLQSPGVVVGVPGASIFKQEWVQWFTQRTVYALYDNDDPGDGGDKILRTRLGSVTKEIYSLHWPEDIPEKYDVRDWIVRMAVREQKPRECMRLLAGMFKKTSREVAKAPTQVMVTVDDSAAPPVITRWEQPAALKDVFTVYKKWLFLANTDAIEVMLAVMMSNFIEGDPLWMFIVSPPGGSKTEMLMSLSRCENAFMISSLSAHSLISGASHNNGDPSLIPKLNGRILVVKDFTAILSKRDQEKDEIFGTLRDAYDGTCVRTFGNGITRSYKSRFSIIAAVTPSIYELSAQHLSLGERFLKYMVGSSLYHASEDEIIRRAVENVNKETAMRDELADVVAALLKRSPPDKLPYIGPEYTTKLVALARFGARMRGVVGREHYRPEIVTGRPSAEVGSRLGKQLSKLAMAIAIVNGRNRITEHEYRLVKKTMLDTIPQRVDDMVKTMWKKAPTVDDTLRTKEISYLTRYPLATVSRLLADMNILDIVTKTGKSTQYQWTVAPYIRKSIDEAEIYNREE